MNTIAPNVIGLDLSLTATGVASGFGSGTIKPKTRGMQRLEDITEGIAAHLNRMPFPIVAVIEGYAYGAVNSRSALSLAELGGVVRYGLHGADISFVEVPPSVLKKFATGKGNAPKDAVFRSALRHERKLKDNNAADAWWLYQLGTAHYDPESTASTLKLRKTRTAMVDRIDWPQVDV